MSGSVLTSFFGEIGDLTLHKECRFLRVIVRVLRGPKVDLHGIRAPQKGIVNADFSVGKYQSQLRGIHELLQRKGNAGPIVIYELVLNAAS
jgi:hypothetical protein